MANYVVEGWNWTEVEELDENGQPEIETRMTEIVSVFFTNKARAEEYRSGLSLQETYITAYKSQCGCLEEGSTEVEGFDETAYCSWCI